MKTVVLLGATGMLGSAVYDVLKDRYRLVLAVRHPEKIDLIERAYGGTGEHSVLPFDVARLYEDYAAKKGRTNEHWESLLDAAAGAEGVINAIGVTIPFVLRDPALTFFVNGAFPHVLARAFGEKLIHITTDCVYDGQAGFPYDENALPSPVDLYGASKSLGEPAEGLTLRTSIVGRELDGRTGLLEWFLQQEGREITGFAEHYWNGMTTHQFGLICRKILESPGSLPRRGVYHVFSAPVSKYEMLLAFQRRYGVNCTIRADRAHKLNRTLATVRDLNSRLAIPTFPEMVAALPN